MVFSTRLSSEGKKPRKKIWHCFCEYVVEFCRTTTMHGFNHMVEPGRHWLEVLFWMLILTGAVGLTAGIINRSYSRYRRDPIVISIEKDFRKWTVSFPGTTACFLNKLNETKAKEVVKRKWNIEIGDKYQYYMDFLLTLSNSSYLNLKDFERFSEDPSFNSIDLGELMWEINLIFDPKILTLFRYDIPADFHETLTEMGICFSFNSFVTPYLKPGGKLNKQIKTAEENSTRRKSPGCEYFTLPCPAKVDGFSHPVHYYVHSPYDLPDSASKHWLASNEYAAETLFTFLSIKFKSGIRNLRLSQRKCHFREEDHVPESPYYSFKLCRMDCRRNLAMELCKCVPHFYVKRDDQPHCGLKGLMCLSKYSEYIIKLVDDGGRKKYPCPCFPSCSETEYIFYHYARFHYYGKEQKLFGYKWGIEKFPKMTLRRDIIFGIEDLLVSFGGTAGFFLGCSLMSGIEVIYFFTLRIVRYFWNTYKKNDIIEKDSEKVPNYKAKKRSRLILQQFDLIL